MSTNNPPPDPARTEYTVVARRYRPQQFAELIGQEHVAQALINALQTSRVAHAYLFTGARGVGKTSAARILAKALNCINGPTPTPCDQCDHCLAIATGEDVDVLEIDGASNNKVDEIRDLRKNVGFRPTRSRYKIYIIDEVHMLSTSAFNALLKTLEEPPPHVKFIFATTEAQEIPITILSRCQRFDFVHVGPAKILEQLKSIVRREGLQADEESLRIVARRAAGSMRDSQSLLDQLLASGEGKLTAERVHAVLGTPGEEQVNTLAAAILNRDPVAALNSLATWVDRGLQLGELLDQLIDYWRGLMLTSCAPELRDPSVSPILAEVMRKQVAGRSLDAVLAGLDVWTTTKARMRGSSHTQILIEMAIVRLCRMEELLSVGLLLQTLNTPGATLAVPAANPAAGIRANPVAIRPPEAGVPSKKNELMGVNGSSEQIPRDGNATLALTESTVQEVWSRTLRHLADKSPFVANQLKSANLPAIFGPNALAIRFHSSYSQAYDACATELNTAKIQESLRKVTGQPVVIRLDKISGSEAAIQPRPAAASPGSNAGDQRKQLMDLPLFRKASDILGAQIWHMDTDFNPAAIPRPTRPAIDSNDTDDPTTPADSDEG